MAKNLIFDVAIIGGGPAGMMAAGKAAEVIAETGKNNASVVIIDKNERFGRKLLLTGGGRCNITQAEFNDKNLVKEYGKQGQFLLSPLSKFGVRETVEFFESQGIKTKTERGGRIFPESDKAQDVLNVLIKYLNKNKVEIITNASVVDFKLDTKTKKLEHLLLNNEQIISAKNYIICTGGKSYPKLGSTGDGFKWAQKFGHTIVPPRPSLVPVKIKEFWVKELQGLSLKNVRLTVTQNGKNQDSRFGEMLFTHFGVSGPIVLDASKKIGELLHSSELRNTVFGTLSERDGARKAGVQQDTQAEGGKNSDFGIRENNNYDIKIIIDLKPGLTFDELDKRIRKDFQKYQNKKFQNALDDLLPQKMIPIIIKLSSINASKHVNLITREERLNLVKLFKNLEMTVDGLLGFDNAIVTCGGVSLNEIDSKTMKSKIVENLYFAGEVLDLDGPCGGYNLQACWTTGFIAGQNAAKEI